MRITLAYNLRTEMTEEQAELHSEEDIDRLVKTLKELKHEVTPVEVSGKPNDVVEELLESRPQLIFNIAEGHIGSAREAFYPGLYEQLNVPFTGGNASLLHMNLDKNLAKTVVAQRGINVPRGTMVTRANDEIPADLRYPIMIKPNSEGSSKGITQDSVVETPAQLKQRITKLLPKYPAGLVIEEFISGRELSVPLLESFPGKILEIVEHTFDLKEIEAKYNIYDYDMKQGGESSRAVKVVCPPELTKEERTAVLDLARKVFNVMSCPDFGRVDIRLREDGMPFFIELNPLPSLHPVASLMTAAHAAKLEYKEVIRLIIKSAAKRYKIPVRSPKKSVFIEGEPSTGRPTVRELGITIGRLGTGVNNAITDVKGVSVGHYTNIQDDVRIPGVKGSTVIRTGVTAVMPGAGDVFHKRMVAGGFVLNGVGEMAGLTQVMEWGWLETPVLLTNSLSVGKVLSGVITNMVKQYPQLGTKTDVVLPVVGETDDSFLNDVRIGTCTSQDAILAMEAAKAGPVEQGSIGAGTGMTSFDFAGGIGTSSRVLTMEGANFTLGTLVLSNFGRMRNLTIDGKVLGRDLDPMFDYERRTVSYGSIIVVLATDAPFLSSQLCRLAKRAALGLGRVGSHAASTSGEIVIAFSTANRLPRTTERPSRFQNVRFISDAYINDFYEAAIECTEESVLNAIFCSNGMTGREGRLSPAIPQDAVIELIQKGREINAGRSEPVV